MNETDKLRALFGPANRGDTAAPVVHRHDDFEHASEDDLAGFEVETDRPDTTTLSGKRISGKKRSDETRCATPRPRNPPLGAMRGRGI